MKVKKRCPYCSAPLQENASFCLHCMKSLDSKTVINKEKSKKPFIIFFVSFAIAILILILLLIIFPLKTNKKNNGNKESSEFLSNETATSSNSAEDLSNSQNDTEKSTEKSIISKTADDFSAPEKSDNSSIPDTPKPEDNENHLHKYTSKVIKSATCGDEGKVLYTCSCGDSYTKVVSATGEHNFVAVTKTVHHDEVGHYEDIQKSRPITIYQCQICNTEFDTLNSYYNHFDNTHKPSYQGDPITIFRENYYTKSDYEYYYEKIWVVDKKAYDEKITTGYKCSVCGKTK